jgi:hypothetical protein
MRGNMKYILNFMILVLIWGCNQSVPEKQQPILMGQPAWFPLGDEVHHAETLPSAEESILSFKAESRWFKCLPRAVSKKEYEEWIKNNPGMEDLQNERSSVFYIPMKLPYPNNLNEIASKNQGAELKFQILKSLKENEINFEITLFAKERVVTRETEHRLTNTLPFLFGFYVDGKPITLESKGVKISGGVNAFNDLVEAGSKKTWNLKVNRSSIDKIVGTEGKTLEIVVLFSERQHIGYLKDGPMLIEDVVTMKGRPAQILIKSNIVTLKRINQQWE